MFKFKNNAIILQLESAKIVIFTCARIIAVFLNLNIIMQNYTYPHGEK